MVGPVRLTAKEGKCSPPIDEVEVVGVLPHLQALAPGRGSDGDDAVIVTFGSLDNAKRQLPFRPPPARPKAPGHREIAHAAGVVHFFVELRHVLDSQVAEARVRQTNEPEEGPQQDTFEATDAPIGKGTTSMGSAHTRQRQNAAGQAKAADGITRIEAAHAVADDVYRLVGTVAVEKGNELRGPSSDAIGRTDARDQHAVSARLEGLGDAVEVAGKHPPAQANVVKTKNAVRKNNRRATTRNDHPRPPGATPYSRRPRTPPVQRVFTVPVQQPFFSPCDAA